MIHIDRAVVEQALVACEAFTTSKALRAIPGLRAALAQPAIARPQAPAPKPGVYAYAWQSNRLAEPITCHLEYVEPEGDVAAGPGAPKRLTLIAAYARGLDVYSLLDDEDMHAIEDLAMLEFERRGPAAPRRIWPPSAKRHPPPRV